MPPPAPPLPLPTPWHACRRRDEAWAALATAKVLTGPGPEWEADDYRAMLEDLAIIFPPAEEAAAGAGVEVVEEDDAGGAEEEGPEGQAEARSPPAETGNPPGGSPAQRHVQRLGWAAAQARDALGQAAERVGAWLARAARAAGGGGRAAASGQGAPAPAPAPGKFAHLAELRPIFVTGLPRSGSTLIEQILSRCAWPGAGRRQPASWSQLAGASCGAPGTAKGPA